MLTVNSLESKQYDTTFFILYIWKGNIKHLMTGTEGKSEFCFPETLYVSRGEAEENIEG
jgi:hypothetical protein